MSNTTEAPKRVFDMKQLAAARAKERIRTARWDTGTAVFSYATLAAVVILKLEGIRIEIVAAVAIFGLALVWVTGLRRGKHLYGRLYEEELHQLQEYYQAKESGATVPSPLTRRETEILRFIARGYMNKQIAKELGLSEQTIKNHLSSILRKLDVNDRTQAVVLAIHNGWISSLEESATGVYHEKQTQ